MTIAIRQVDPDTHADDFIALLDASGEPTGEARDAFRAGESDLWLAFSDDTPIGGLLARPVIAADGRRRGAIQDIVVLRDYRREGIGMQLTEVAEAWYREQGLDGMQISIDAHNESARRMYGHEGYYVSGERLRMWKNFR